MQLPMLPERRLADPGSGFLRDHLRAWSAAGFPDDATVATYQAAISQWPASHCALEYHRWLFRSGSAPTGAGSPKRCGRRCRSRSAASPARSTTRFPAPPSNGPGATSPARFTSARLPGVGHFPHEEDPSAFTALLLDWLAGVVPVEP